MAIDPTAPAGLGTFWEDQSETTPKSVLNATPGYTITAGTDQGESAAALADNEIPYMLLRGSETTESAINDANAETLFPTYNGTTKKLAHPSASSDPNFETEFAKAPSALSPDVFLGWHSAYQLEYIQSKGTVIGTTTVSNTANTLSWVVGSTTVKQVTIGTSPNTVTAVVSDDGLRVYILEQLQKRDFSVMPKADQQAIAGSSVFAAIGAKFGLTTNLDLIVNGDGQTGSPTKDGIDTLLNGITTAFNNRPSYSLMDATARDYFVDQINLIRAQVTGGMSIFSPADIKAKVDEIVTRFNRARLFADVPAEASGANSDSNQWTNIVSLDGGAAIKQGYRVFIEQEKRMRDLANASKAISDQGTLKDKSLDVPNLVFLFQLQANLKVEAKSTAETQQVNQQNELLKTYSRMQSIINQTTKNFDHGDAKDNKALYGKGADTALAGNIPDANEADEKVISMFEDALNGALHPLEELNGLTKRPTEDIYHNTNKTLNGFLKPHWDGFATQLSDTVTLLNQNSQLKQNDISSMDKQKSRNFDLANSALQKLSDMIQNIARAGG